VLKAFSISKNTAAVDILLLKFRVTWSASRCLFTISKITFSNSLPVEGKGLIGRKFLGIGIPYSFGKATTFASFQDVGKRDSQMQCLIRWVKWTSGPLGRCLRHSFGMPSIPQAFFNFKEFSNFCKSQGLVLPGGGGSLSAASSRTWTIASTRRSWFYSHRSWGVNRFSKQSAIALALSTGWSRSHIMTDGQSAS
jgi:hypothetical protein